MDWLYVSRLKQHQVYSPGHDWQSTFNELGLGLGVRKNIKLLESALVKVPVVAGHLKPVILLPLGILSNLPAGEVEAVLLHELAHIRRHDYLVNLGQRMAELVFFFNPGLLWISDLIRNERENCCDDMAIAASRDKLRYVQALVSFREHSLREPKIAVGLFGRKQQLVNRLQRIVYNRNNSLSQKEAGFVTLNLLLLCTLLLLTGETMFSGKDIKGRTPTVAQVKITSPASANDGIDVDTSAPDDRPLSDNIDEHAALIDDEVVMDTMTRSAHSSVNKTRVSGSSVTDNQEQPGPEQQMIMLLQSNKAPEAARLETAIIETARSKVMELTGTKTMSQQEELLLVHQRAEADRAQAVIDRQLAERDRIQAGLDRQQADRHRDQAEIDRKHAEIDREQAAKDRLQADKDRQQAEKDRARAELDRQIAEKERLSYATQE